MSEGRDWQDAVYVATRKTVCPRFAPRTRRVLREPLTTTRSVSGLNTDCDAIL